MKYFATILVYCLFYFIRSSRHWSEEEREQLNEVVKNYPCLYDTSTCKTYKDITVKTNAKVEISKLLESCSVEDVTVQWGSLVDKFRRTKKQYRGERGQIGQKFFLQYFLSFSFLSTFFSRISLNVHLFTSHNFYIFFPLKIKQL